VPRGASEHEATPGENPHHRLRRPHKAGGIAWSVVILRQCVEYGCGGDFHMLPLFGWWEASRVVAGAVGSLKFSSGER
jgi:hypothetical protein